MAYTFDLNLNTKNFTIEIDTLARYGYFEHNELGEERGGGLWFDEQNMLCDYDGVCELPKEVKDKLVQKFKIYPDEIDNF